MLQKRKGGGGGAQRQVGGPVIQGSSVDMPKTKASEMLEKIDSAIRDADDAVKREKRRRIERDVCSC